MAEIEPQPQPRYPLLPYYGFEHPVRIFGEWDLAWDSKLEPWFGTVNFIPLPLLPPPIVFCRSSIALSTYMSPLSYLYTFRSTANSLLPGRHWNNSAVMEGSYPYGGQLTNSIPFATPSKPVDMVGKHIDAPRLGYSILLDLRFQQRMRLYLSWRYERHNNTRIAKRRSLVPR